MHLKMCSIRMDCKNENEFTNGIFGELAVSVICQSVHLQGLLTEKKIMNILFFEKSQ